jgi:hypothetical protein
MLTPVFTKQLPPHPCETRKGLKIWPDPRLWIYDAVNRRSINTLAFGKIKEVIRVSHRLFIRFDVLCEWDQKENVIKLISHSKSSHIIHGDEIESGWMNVGDYEIVVFGKDHGHVSYRQDLKKFQFSIPRPQPTQIFVYTGGGRFYTENEDRVLYYYDIWQHEKRAVFKLPLPSCIRRHILNYIKF